MAGARRCAGYNRMVSNKSAWNDPAGFELLTISGNDSAIDVRAEDSIGNGPLHVISGWSAHEWHYDHPCLEQRCVRVYVDGNFRGPLPLINAFPVPNRTIVLRLLQPWANTSKPHGSALP